MFLSKYARFLGPETGQNSLFFVSGDAGRAGVDSLAASGTSLCFLALVRYGRYLDPLTGRPCAPERLVEHLADLRRRRWLPLRRALLWQHVSWLARKAGL